VPSHQELQALPAAINHEPQCKLRNRYALTNCECITRRFVRRKLQPPRERRRSSNHVEGLARRRRGAGRAAAERDRQVLKPGHENRLSTLFVFDPSPSRTPESKQSRSAALSTTSCLPLALVAESARRPGQSPCLTAPQQRTRSTDTIERGGGNRRFPPPSHPTRARFR